MERFTEMRIEDKTNMMEVFFLLFDGGGGVGEYARFSPSFFFGPYVVFFFSFVNGIIDGT